MEKQTKRKATRPSPLDSDVTYPTSLIGYIDTPVICLNLECKIIHINNAALERFGWQKENIIGRCLSDAVNSTEHALNIPLPILNLKKIKTANSLLLHTENNLYSINWTMVRLIDKKETISGHLLMTTDIVRKQKVMIQQIDSKQEMKTHQSKQTSNTNIDQTAEFYLENILANMPGHVFWIDVNDVFLGSNDQQAKSIGFETGNDIVGKSLDEVGKILGWQAKILDTLKKNNQKVIDTGISICVEEDVVWNDKIPSTYLSRKSPLRDQSGKIIGLLGIATDITELKEAKARAEKLSKTTQIYLENIIANMPDHVYWSDRKGVYLGCNEQQAKSIGLNSRSSFIGKTVFDLANMLNWDKNLAKTIYENDDKIMQTGISTSIEEDVIWTDGKLKTFLSKKTPLRDEKNEVIGLLGISIDITARKQIEKELIDAKRKAESANQAKSNFLASMSHELRTPLNGILGMAQILSEKKQSNQNKAYITMIQQAGEHLLALINDILDFSKLEAGKLEIIPKVFNLKKLIKDIVKNVEHLLSGKDINFHLIYDVDIPDILIADPLRIRQILTNLVSNAIKFTKNGYIKILVTCEDKADDIINLKISIIDTGIGIGKNNISHIFQRFTQVESQYSRRFEGAGLGLAICKQLIDEMGGEIGVKSEINKGSTFWCKIPFTLTNEEQNKKLKVINNHISKQSNKNLPAGSKILLIEDNILNQMVAKIMIEGLDCELDIAATGKAGIEKYKKNHYDVIITDIGLPDMDGLQVTKTIRKIEKNTRHIPIIAMTAHVLEEDKTNCYKAGIDDIITKPVVQEELYKLLSKWLR